MKKPLVSVVMSVYNSEKWLSYSIESIINQTFTDFEFLIINDGSTDNSNAILDEYSKRDKRINFINQSNIGLTKSLIKGIKLSKGDIIVRIDADDLASSERIEKQLIELENKKLDLIATNFSLIDKNGYKIKYYDIRKKQEEILKKLLGGNSFFPHSSVMFRKEVYFQLGGYNPFFNKSQDIDLWLRFLQNKFKTGVCNLNKPLTSIRIHEEQITHKNIDDIFTVISILNFYSRKNNQAEITAHDSYLQTIIIDKIKLSKYYKIINFKNKFRFFKNNIFSKEILNITEIFKEFLSYQFLKTLNLFFLSDMKLYEKLASDTILKNEL